MITYAQLKFLHTISKGMSTPAVIIILSKCDQPPAMNIIISNGTDPPVSVLSTFYVVVIIACVFKLKAELILHSQRHC